MDSVSVILVCLSSSCCCVLRKGNIGKCRSVQLLDEPSLGLPKPGLQMATTFYRAPSSGRPETLDQRLPLFEQPHDVAKPDLGGVGPQDRAAVHPSPGLDDPALCERDCQVDYGFA